MDYNRFDDHQYFTDSKQRKSTNRGRVWLAALVGGLLGALIMAVVAPYYLYGNIIPWPSHLSWSSGAEYQLPVSPNNAQPINNEIGSNENSITTVAETVGPTVVGVINRGYVTDWFGNRSLVERGSGSGFIIDPMGFIVTNEHVIEGAEEVYITLSSGAQIQAEVIGSDSWSDIAVLKIDLFDLSEGERNLPFVALGDSSNLRVGQTVIAIGNPLGMEFARTTTAGIISAVDRLVTVGDRQYSLIQTDAAINSGNSGGPLLDLNGNVIGINQIKISDLGIEGLGFAIPADQAKPIIEQLINYGKVIRPYLGITGLPMNRSYAAYLDSQVDYGIYIDEVVTGSPVDKAGVKAGDIITAIDDEKIISFTELQRILYSHKSGDTILVEIYRIEEHKTYKLNVTLQTTPEY